MRERSSGVLCAERSAFMLKLVDELDDLMQQHRDGVTRCVQNCFQGILSVDDNSSSPRDQSSTPSTARGPRRPSWSMPKAPGEGAGALPMAAAILEASSQRKQQPPSPCRSQVSASRISPLNDAETARGSGTPMSPCPRVAHSAWTEEAGDDESAAPASKEPQADLAPLVSVAESERNIVEAFNMVNVVPSDANEENPEKISPTRGLRSVVESVQFASRSQKAGMQKDAKRKSMVRKSALLSESKRMELQAQQTRLQKIVSSKQWEWFSVTLILLNSLFIGVATQYLSARATEDVLAKRPLHTDEPVFFTVCQLSFGILFTVELALRWLAEGFLGFWQTPDVGWNVLDLSVVIVGLADLFAGLIVSASADQSPVTVLRVVRVVRVIRVARIIRVMRFFRELRMMIMSIMNSFKSLLWVVLVLLILFYVFGTSFATATTNHLETLVMGTDTPNTDLVDNFGTLDKSVLSLYMAMSGGNDWALYFFALEDLGLFYQLLFLVFITFAVFAVFNIVTGVFVDSAMQSSQSDRDSIVQDEMAAQKAYLKSMQTLFEEIDEDESGFITQDEFESRVDDARVAAYFNSLKLDVSDARLLFELLDEDGSKKISPQQFVSGCQKLQGESRSLDTKIMQQEVKILRKSVESVHRLLRSQCSSMGDNWRGSIL
eukprot:TRINITY_DN16565_c0_g1_i3.p1 TRINITY_DN16565_c0_g1~~TRINITY_DN16565_c0_g1_i3.p1  ORF type:complete len:662 (+),score=109.06 TRINITY_DN16565_c0_g1_i3:100-2085(+)